jgi:hypothetical protein
MILIEKRYDFVARFEASDLGSNSNHGSGAVGTWNDTTFGWKGVLSLKKLAFLLR